MDKKLIEKKLMEKKSGNKRLRENIKKIVEEQAQVSGEAADNGSKDFAEAIAKSEDWEIHMQLSPLRQSILNWYEFERDSRLLEINAGYGALTGLFCERCKTVTSVIATAEEAEILSKRYAKNQNLHIVQGNLPEIFNGLLETDEQYDYLIAYGSIAYVDDPAATINQWMNYVKPGGKLLMTAENRYGLKYFCGAKDPYTALPFDGINGYIHHIHQTEGTGKCISRQEFVSAIEDAGISRYQFYYPVPDSRMPQMIFSDDYRKGINTAERLVDYDYEDAAMLGVEHRIFCEMIDSGALPFMANSFLVELTKEGNLSDIIYAVTTTDRGKTFGTATTVRRSGIVKKRALWAEGNANLQKLHENTNELIHCGIPVVQTKLEEDACGLVLSMPYIDEEGLSTVLKRLVTEDREQFIRLFDEIYGYIMNASEKLPKKAYLDLAPCNCFYIKEDGSLLFYDQEFIMENCPAQFAMYRTLKYFYASARTAEQALPLRTMYERYGIDEEKIAAFEKKEEKFIQSVRKMDHYKRIFQWATPDYQKINEQIKKMAKLSAPKKDKPYHIGYVPGVFDLFHTGHLNLLERCKSRCDYLIVGVLTDELVEFYKGSKTVISYEDRARVIMALSIVDEVIPVDFSNTDKLDAWNQLHYDCHFSGDDHVNHWNDVWEELKKRGSNMEFFPYTQGISSTQIRGKLKQDTK